MNVAMMTSGGLAPCLSSSVAYLVEFWAAALKAGTINGLTIRMYMDGYKGVLTGDSMVLNPELYDDCSCLHDLGGSPIGNSRVKVRSFVCGLWGWPLVYISFAVALLPSNQTMNYLLSCRHHDLGHSSQTSKTALLVDSSKTARVLWR